ncbi:hypothetical protein [Priestia megaterium]|uniref:hypothetical protein n=1 Tax=Priestia megaterium TaxID=1404 RepID=UPI000BED26A1|nr:hypothetical protein [Priestia megaterium]PED63987.1 hypothetical protein CON20_23780 [Priestia megaterium]
MNNAYVETLSTGEILVEVQVQKKKIEAYFHEFKNWQEFKDFKKENNDINFIMICPSCGTKHERLLALSRKDNKTSICDDCGTQEALEELSGI